MNPLWDAATALLGIAVDCLDDCSVYTRQFVDTASPVHDCDTLAVVIGNARAKSGSCIGRIQLTTNLDVTIVRCCEPVGELTEVQGYTPPTPEEIQAAAACLARDAWTLYECIMCRACEALGAVRGVEACCDRQVPPPEIVWMPAQGGCRSAIIRVPVIVTACCTPEEP